MRKYLSFLIAISVLYFFIASVSSPQVTCAQAPGPGCNVTPGNPDGVNYDVTKLGWKTSSGTGPCSPAANGLVSCGGGTDPGAPQFTSLIAGSQFPAIKGTYKINPGGEPWGATLIGLEGAGKNVLVPQSGYSIGSGQNVMVIFVKQDRSGITLKYTCEDNIADGYTVFINGITVRQAILDMYNQANLPDPVTGVKRTKLPALRAGEVIGAGSGNVLLAVRDKGSFMDPRSNKDWWNGGPAGSSGGGPTLFEVCTIKSSCTNGLRDPNLVCSPPPGITLEKITGTFRPFPCQNCNKNLPPKFTEIGFIQPKSSDPNGEVFEVMASFDIPAKKLRDTAAADAFKAIDCGLPPVSSGKPPPNDLACNPEKRCIVRDWGGLVQLDTKETMVPFAGFRNAANDKPGDVQVDNALLRYLADYYDGDSIYNGQYYDFSKYSDILQAFAEGGVFRKLAWEDLQDQLRKYFVLRFAKQTGYLPPHDYPLKAKYKRPSDGVIIDIPAPPQKITLSDFAGAGGKRLKPIKSEYGNGSDTEVYEKDLAAWKALDPVDPANNPKLSGKWYLLWQSIPMVSREDAPGTFNFTIETQPGAIGRADASRPMKAAFPHLARTHEITNILEKLFANGATSSAQNLLPVPGALRPSLLASTDPFNAAPSGNSEVLASTRPPTVESGNTKLLAELKGGIPPTDRCYLAMDFVPIINLDENTGDGTACWQLTGYTTKPEKDNGQWGCDWAFDGVYAGKPTSRPRLGGSCLYWPPPRSSTTNCMSFDGLAPLGGPGEKDVNFTFGIRPDAQSNEDLGPNGTGDFAKYCAPWYNWNLTCKIRQKPNGKYEVAGPCVPLAVQPPPPTVACGNNIIYTPDAEKTEPSLEDKWNKGKLDVICTDPNPVTARISVLDDQLLAPKNLPACTGLADGIYPFNPAGCPTTAPCTTVDPYKTWTWGWKWEKEDCTPGVSCKCTGGDWVTSADSRRKFAIKVTEPYLKQIWEQSKNIVNIRKDGVQIFEKAKVNYNKILESDIKAKTPVGVSFTLQGAKELGTSADKALQPTSGGCPKCGPSYLYYPHLTSAACIKAAILKTVWPLTCDQNQNCKQISDPNIEKLWQDCDQCVKTGTCPPN